MKGKCVRKVTAASGVWQEPSGKTTNGSSVLSVLYLDTPIYLSLQLVYTLSLSRAGLFWCPQLLLFSFCHHVSHSLAYPSSFFMPHPSHLVLCMLLLLSHSLLLFTHLPSDVFLPPCLPFFMSFWPRSHFPNWLSGSLIILQHPCCRLFYLSACRHPNPLISKYPSSAHTASQQHTAFLVYFSIVHTDGPSTTSRQAQYKMTLRTSQATDPQENSSGILMDQNIPGFFWLSTLTISLTVKFVN